MKSWPALALATLLACGSAASGAEQQTMDPRFAPQPSEAACRPLELAATGGPVLDGPKTLAVRATAITWPTARTLPSKPGRR